MGKPALKLANILVNHVTIFSEDDSFCHKFGIANLNMLRLLQKLDFSLGFYVKESTQSNLAFVEALFVRAKALKINGGDGGGKIPKFWRG